MFVPVDGIMAVCLVDTTRGPREHEIHGVDYFFVRMETMRAMIAKELFIDVGEYNGNLYGTTEAAVRNVAQKTVNGCSCDGDA
jgi:guanylate kinase